MGSFGMYSCGGKDLKGDYMDKISRKIQYLGIPIIDAGQGYRKLAEKEARLIQVSGFDVDKLIELFAAGYTLQPPKQSLTSLNDLL